MISSNKINHQFLNSDFFFPTWDVNTLVLGTFNPSCGEETDYFYGRCQNNFWRTIEEISDKRYRFFQNNLKRKIKFMKDHKFGCTDIIKSVELVDISYKNDLCGKGYSDKILFTMKKCSLEYNFDEIKSFVKKNKVLKIINTWGTRKKPNLFKYYVEDFKFFCCQNNTLYIDDCPSPSGRLRGQEHKIYLKEFYKTHLLKTRTVRES